MNQLVFGSYNKRTKKETSVDRLSRNESAVESYLNDPLSGYIPTARFFYDLLDGLIIMHSEKRNRLVRKDLPILFVSGDEDPVGDYGRGVWKAAQHYQKAGLENVATMLFEHGRHELLHETNKAEVFTALRSWMENIAKPAQERAFLESPTGNI